MVRTAIMTGLLVSTALGSAAAFAQTSPQILPPVGEDVAEPSQPEDETADQDGTIDQSADRDDEGSPDISAPGAGGLGDEIVVQGRFIPNETRSTASVISVLSAEDIARQGDGDIASSLERVTGLSVDNGGFVYVRGLGDRYSQALLNGTPLPSPEPLKRVVPLDLFPTSVLASATVQKSYSVNYPGEFGGGVINLTSAALPKENFLTAGLGIGINTETTGKLGYTYYGSASDWTGFDDGTRDIPDILKSALNSGSRIQSGSTFTNEDLQDIGASLVNAETSLLQRNFDIPPIWSASLSGGYTVPIGAADLGIIANASYSNSFNTRDSIQQDGFSSPSSSVLVEDGRLVRTDHNIVVSGLYGMGLDLDEHKIRWTNVYIRDTLKQGGLYAVDNLDIAGGIDPTNRAGILRQQTMWIERQLIDTVLSGEFRFGAFDVNLRGNYANSQREAPYQREFNYVYNDRIGDYQNNLQENGSGASIAFSDLNEDVWSGAVDVAYALPTARDFVLSAGYAYNSQNRDATRRDFAFLPLGSSLPQPVPQQRPDFLLSDLNIRGFYTPLVPGDGIVFTEALTTAGSQAYEADLEVHAGYVRAEAEILPFVTMEGGVRYETARQQVTALDIFNEGNLDQTAPLKNDYFLPAATVTWNFAEDMQLRANASKTIARPQFRELARPQFIDPDTGRIFSGNPFLVDSKLFNAEARYEWYFDRDQRFSLAGFYKRIDNPIEPVSDLPAGQTGLRTTFANAPKAELYGGEVEIVKYFDLFDLGSFFETKRIFTSANYTYTLSNLQVKDGDQTILFDTRGLRPASEVFFDGTALTGQSKHIANLQIGFEDTDRLQQITMLLRYASDRVTTRSIAGGNRQPDVIEQPGLQLDIVAREELTISGQPFEMKFEARNITGTRFREYQPASGDNGIEIIRQQYDRGTTLALSVAARF
jgi:outer membrane receptor protein involved in Fe transport